MMKRLLVVFILLTVLVGMALPVLAGEAPMAGWQQIFPPTSPPPRADTALAYDTDRGVAVLFGGYAYGSDLDDTWEFDGSTWVARQPAHRPPPRFGHAMAYDQARGVTVLFGGVTEGAEEYNDTWLWNGLDWEQAFPADSPCYRWLHGMYYDSQRQVVVVVGGTEAAAPSCDGQQPEAAGSELVSPESSYGDTYEWDGVNWTAQAIYTPARHGMGVAYDSRRGVAVMFGGDDGYGPNYFSDTWERTGAGDWVRLSLSRHPSARQRMSAAYFPQPRRMVIYGGYNWTGVNLDDTWGWNGSQWLKANLAVHPSGGFGGMVYDPVANGLLLYVGLSATGQYVGETWYLR